MFQLSSVTQLVVAAAVLAACSGGSSGNGGPNGPPTSSGSVSLTIPSPLVTLSSGGTGTLAVNIARGGSFTGTVTLSVSGLPTGVTGAFSPAALDGATTSSTLTLTAVASAVAATTTITITAQGSGVTTQTAQATVVLTQPAIAISATPATLSITAGLTGQTTVSIGRSTGFTGAVTLVLDAPPAGFTGSFNASPTTAGSSVLTLSVVASVAPGSYPVTIKGSAAGAVDKTASLTITVVGALPLAFTGTVDPVEMELPAGRGWTTSGVVSVQRVGGYTGPVAVSVQGLSFPAAVGVTPATIAPGQTLSNVLGLAVDNAAPGVYSGTVRLTAAGYAEQSIPIRVRVSAPSTGNITWSFCRADRVPRYFAVRDGTGAWQHIVPNGPAGATAQTPATYSFSISQSTASVAMVWLGEKTSASTIIEGFHWNVFYMTRQEIVDLAAQECITNRDVSSREATGSVTGYQSFDAIIASMSRNALASVGSTGPLTTTLSARNVPAGPFDLMLTRANFAQGGFFPVVQSMILKRGLNPAAGGSVGALTFATDGFAPATGALTFENTGGESFTNTMTFMTADGLNAWIVAAGVFANTTRTWYGVPAARQVAGDLHQIVASTQSTTARRQVIHFAKDVSTKSVGFGPALSQPTVTAVLSTPWVVRAAGTLGSDYTTRVAVYYREQQADPRTLTIVATRGFLGGQTQYDVSVPDLSAATGFTAFWNMRRGALVRWIVTGGEGSVGDQNDVPCTLTGYCPVKAVDGATYRSAQATGTVTIP